MNKKALYECIMKSVAKEVKKVLNENTLENLNNVFDQMFDQYVPGDGPANTIAGELLRATARIEYRFFNDGDMAGEGYGNETVNPVVRYLYKTIINDINASRGLKNVINRFYEMVDFHNAPVEEQYEELIYDLKECIISYITSNDLVNVQNNEDMWDYRTNDDVDDSWDDDDDWTYDEDE